MWWLMVYKCNQDIHDTLISVVVLIHLIRFCYWGI